jgi:hypothetical protein
MADVLTVQFRKAIRTKIASYTPSVYYRRAVNAPSIYAIYDIDSVTRDEEAVEQWQLAVSLFASGDNTEALDNLADEIWEGLNHWFYSDQNGLYFNTYQSVRTTITDEENGNHTRRRLVFTIHLFS